MPKTIKYLKLEVHCEKEQTEGNNERKPQNL